MASPPRQVVVDDSDSQIHYSGSGWFQDKGSQDNAGNYGPTYEQTSHGTNGNDSFSFSFSGSSITVFGTTALKQIANTNSYDPSWECFIDQISIGATQPFQFEENNWVLCSQPSLNDGAHELSVNVTSSGTTFWFDYLTFVPPPEASYLEAVLQVQNTDSAIQYGAGWGSLGSTANMTTVAGSQVKFDFVGTSLTWVGFIPVELSHNASSGSYVIDNGGSVNFNLAGLPASATTTVYFQDFFSIPDLTAGPHSVLVTYNGPGTPLTLDYLLITNTSLPGTAGATVSSHSTNTATGSSSTTSPKASQTSHSGNTGAIVGGVLGGIVFIILLLIALLWCRRRRQVTHVESKPGFLGTGGPPSSVGPLRTATSPSPTPHAYSALAQQVNTNPYMYHRPYPSSVIPNSSRNDVSSLALPYDTTSTSDAYPISNAQSQFFSPTHTHNVSIDTSDVSGYASGTVDQIRAIRKGQNPEGTPTISSIVHEDSGMRLVPRQRNVITEDVPPVYTER